jgi:digeranylgeranylglycerophospholipid reductase
MAIKCNVLVVGAGPAGSSAARAAALNGANVILIEKMKNPGKIACGEATNSLLIPYLPLKIPKKQLIWRTNGMSFDFQDIHIEKYGSFWEGYSIDRINFDRWLANEAVKAGAKILTNTELIGLKHDEHFVNRAIVKTPKGELEIEPKIVIAADGVESDTLKLLGLYKPKKGDIAEIYSIEVKNAKIQNPFLEQIYMGDYIDGGYGYIFSKTRDRLNVGVGSVFKQNLQKSFEEFSEIPRVKQQLKGCKIVKEKIGKASIIPFIKDIVFGNVLLTGDAACQNFKPYAEGILPGIICGDICGKTASLYLKKKADLNSYPKRIERKIGYMFRESDEITNIIYDLFSMKDKKKFLLVLALASNLFSYDKIRKMKRQSYEKIKEMIEAESKKVILPKIQENLECLYVLLRSIVS